jgi:DNA processing protein
VDTVAHASALEGGGVTLAVLGCGVDRTYPPENVALARRLTVVSEHPPGTPPAAHHFPGRNRVIAALAAGSVVVEGRARSGAMITASASLDCGRTVFAVPGRAGDPLAEGPNRLIREGAVIVESAADVFAELGWSPAPPAAAPTLAPDLVEVFAALDTQPRLLDDVALTAGVTASAAQAALTRLLLAGLVEQGAGGRYRLRS